MTEHQSQTSFTNKFLVHLRVGSFKIRTITSTLELEQTLRLRSECFGRTFENTNYEMQADHLVVEDEDGHFVGAYRLTLLEHSSKFETEEDFDLTDWLGTPQKKLELAWACTKPTYREGHVIHLLWRGLSEYLKISEAQVLFGPASVGPANADSLMEIQNYIRGERKDLQEGLIQPRRPLFEVGQSSNSAAHTQRRRIPALLRAYLMAGALVLLQPVFDPDTDCYDFLTVLDVENSSHTVKNHFQI